MKKIGFIGAGNMGSAMIGGMVQAGFSNIIVADKNQEAVNALCKKWSIHTADNLTVAQEADILFLAVKPNILPDVITQIRNQVRADTLIVSIAAGKTLSTMENAFGRECKLARIMPNTPALVGEAMCAVALNSSAARIEYADDITTLFTLLKSFGRAELVPESLMDAVTAVSGSAPAYVFMLIEAMADAAVLGGMPREQAYTFAAQAVLGSAKMVLDTNLHPGALKDMVCSPGGTTIEAVKVLEQSGFRSSVIEAMQSCMDKSKAMQ